ncbi:MAG: 3-deoxy-D-manno-octulosonic acid transferase [Phycisphaerales bacterium]
MIAGPIFDIAYLLAAALTAPFWLRKRRAGWGERFGRITPAPPPTPPNKRRLLLHAVSVGEANMLRPLVDAILAGHADSIDLVIAATTDTGIARARALYADRCAVVRYPLDASWAVRRFLRAIRPDAVALAELELWPNFIAACARRDIPVCVINGRLSARSFKGYRLARPILRSTFNTLAFAAAQDDDYAQRFVHMGVDPLRCIIAGNMKWDAAPKLPDPKLDAAAEQLAEHMGIDRTRPLIVAGSTAPGEHELILRALWAVDPSAQLLCAPRKPEWFDDAARVLPACIRRSAPPTPPTPNAGLFLLDTIGELRAAYHLAHIVIVGRSFGTLHGSDPMEPAALAKPIIIGPRTTDFEQAVRALGEADAILQTIDEQLPDALRSLLTKPDRRDTLARNAKACVDAHRGATQRHLDLLLGMLRTPARPQR